MELYHGSADENLKTIETFGTIFDGIFALTDSNPSHGNGIIYKLEVDDEKVLTNYALNYEIEHDLVKSVFEAVVGEDASWQAVIEDSAEFVDAESSWEAQRLRGKVAKKLGYDAVEMNDEHGRSYLVLSAKIKRII